ncbi:MAG: prepilin-type N-terminal cleavage/methylation domain-containing protein, partial [Synergistaceae bacterium]|nr:prepilin-type N-terminal cleavage/methylation domain-containing protein [Synergistaceae bacterium]
MGLYQAIIKLKILKLKKFSGFSLIELLIALLILTAMAGSILLNFRDFNKVSAEQEADRIMRWLYNIM